MKRARPLALMIGLVVAGLTVGFCLKATRRAPVGQERIVSTDRSVQERLAELEKVQLATPGEVVGTEWPPGSRVSLYLGEQKDFVSGARETMQVIKEDVGPEETEAVLRPESGKGGAFVPEGIFTSPVIKSKVQFDRMALYSGREGGSFVAWMGGSSGPVYQKYRQQLGGTINLEVRFSPDGENWSEWKTVEGLKQSDVLGEEPALYAETVEEIQLANPARCVQYRVTLCSKDEKHAPVFRGLPIALFDSPKAQVHYAKGRVQLEKVPPSKEPAWNEPPARLGAGRYECFIGEGAVSIRDVRAPSHPLMVGHYYPDNDPQAVTTHPARHVSTSGNYAYVAYDIYPGYAYRPTSGLWILDLTDPQRPHRTESHIDIPATDLSVSGRFLYIVSGYRHPLGLFVFDITNPSRPRQIAHVECYAGRRIAISGRFAYVVGEDGLLVVDISKPAEPTGVFLCKGLGILEEIAIEGEQVILKSAQHGIVRLKYIPV